MSILSFLVPTLEPMPLLLPVLLLVRASSFLTPCTSSEYKRLALVLLVKDISHYVDGMLVNDTMLLSGWHGMLYVVIYNIGVLISVIESY